MQFESDRELPLAADGEPVEPLRRFEVRARAGGAGGQREAAAPARGAGVCPASRARVGASLSVAPRQARG